MRLEWHIASALWAVSIAAATLPATNGPVDDAIARGMDYLLTHQNADGSWGSPRRTKSLNIYAPVPGAHQAFRGAVTALCLEALLEGDVSDPAVDHGAEAALTWLERELPGIRRATPAALYNIWTHAYSIQALLRARPRRQKKAERRRLEHLVEQQIDMLRRYESVDGGWGYYDFRAGAQHPSSQSTAFVNATVLIALHEARQAGFRLPDGLAARAVAATRRMAKPDFTYLYSGNWLWWPMSPVNRAGGSLGRSQACNLALRLWGDERLDNAVLADGVERLLKRHGWLDMGRKRPVPHESWFSVAGYYFYYGHYYAACCLQELPSGQRREPASRLAALVTARQEKDGSWWDFPFYSYHQAYGTAFALMTLNRCR